MASAFLKFSAIILFLGINAGLAVDQPVTEVCLGCLCQAVSGCKQGLQCDGDACGLFRITWAYWADAGKPTIDGSSPEAPGAYPTCTNDPGCAARTVQLYMNRFAQDCNGDGQIDCYDYAAIHKLGGYGCKADLPFKFHNTFNQCLAYVASYQG
ncbi:PREDICTED: lysozyme 2-like [Papilio polytes]|uniref:lysozyme n=1 Tax=Papilio polytes TaxID=76194 RepID=I4DML5_PAPPL|nr:lysozyme 2-like precursor [Papilio polytes]BAM19155.1 simila to CG6426 [Papilio polytes]